MAPPASPPPISSRKLLGVWLALGLQSFGGGGATMTLIRRAVIEQQGWVTADEFARDWAICTVAPGINLLALTILIGRRIAGTRGIFLCLLGMMLPSVAMTIVMTAFYARIRDAALVQHALKAIIPASVGLGLFTAYEMAKPPIVESGRLGNGFYLLAFLLLGVSVAAMLLFRAPVIVILVGAGLISALVSGIAARKNPATEEASPS